MDEREKVAQERAYEIRQRAYQIWEREGRPMGRDREHWLMAERELAYEQGKPVLTEPQSLAAAAAYEREVKNFLRQYRANDAMFLTANSSGGVILKRARGVGRMPR